MDLKQQAKLLSAGFRIIRVCEATCEVQMLRKPGRWARLDKKETLEEAYRSFENYLTDKNTIRF